MVLTRKASATLPDTTPVSRTASTTSVPGTKKKRKHTNGSWRTCVTGPKGNKRQDAHQSRVHRSAKNYRQLASETSFVQYIGLPGPVAEEVQESITSQEAIAKLVPHETN